MRANSCYTLPRAGQSPVTLSLFPIEPLGTPLQPCAPLPNTARAPGAALRIKAKGLTVPPPHQTPVSLFTHPECPPTSTASHRGCSLCIEHSFPSTLCDPASPHQSVLEHQLLREASANSRYTHSAALICGLAGFPAQPPTTTTTTVATLWDPGEASVHCYIPEPKVGSMASAGPCTHGSWTQDWSVGS